MPVLNAEAVKRGLLEGFVVVASILIAFAIDAWWDGRSDQAAKRALLERLQADFAEIKPELLQVQHEHQLRLQSAVTLLERFSVGDKLDMTEDVDRDVSNVFIGSRTFQPGTGAIDTFVNGEGSRLVDNDRLADLLLKWPGLLEELQEEERRLLRVATDRWTPYLASQTNLAPYIEVVYRQHPEFGEIPKKHLSGPARSPLEVDQRFINMVSERFAYQSLAIRDIEPVIDAVNKIHQELEQELQGVR